MKTVRQQQLDFDAIAKAGITQTEFAKLAKVSRVTVNNWVRGHTSPHDYIVSRVSKLLRCVALGVRDKRLPLNEDLTAQQRARTLTKLIANYVVQMTRK